MRFLKALPFILALVAVSCTTAPAPAPSPAASPEPAPAAVASPEPAPAASPAASPAPSPKAPVPSPSASPAASPAPSPKASPAVVREVRQILKEIRVTYPDGFLSSLNEYTYDDQARLLTDSEKNGSEILVSQRQTQYKDDGSVEIRVLDGDRKVKNKTIQTWTDGRLVQEKVFNDKDELQSSSEFKYNDAGQKVSWTIQGKGTSTTASEYTWTGNKLTAIVVLDAARSPIKKYQRSYDAAGNLIREDEMDGKGTLIRKTLYTWADGRLVKEESRSPQDAVQKSTNYSYDALGRMVKSELFNRKGDLMEIQLRTWAEMSAIVPNK